MGASLGSERITAVAIVAQGGASDCGLFVPPSGQDLDFLAAAAFDRPNLPIYITNAITGQTLVLALKELLPSDPNLWGVSKLER